MCDSEPFGILDMDEYNTNVFPNHSDVMTWGSVII